MASSRAFVVFLSSASRAVAMLGDGSASTAAPDALPSPHRVHGGEPHPASAQPARVLLRGGVVGDDLEPFTFQPLLQFATVNDGPEPPAGGLDRGASFAGAERVIEGVRMPAFPFDPHVAVGA